MPWRRAPERIPPLLRGKGNVARCHFELGEEPTGVCERRLRTGPITVHAHHRFFAGPGSLAVTSSKSAPASTTIAVAADLAQAAPGRIALVLAQVSADEKGEAGRLDDAGQNVRRRAVVTFRVAPVRQDPCMSETQIGPFELSVADGALTVAYVDDFLLNGNAMEDVMIFL